MNRICLLASGKLGAITLQKMLRNNHNVQTVLTNTKSNEIIQLCQSHNIHLLLGNPRSEQMNTSIQELSFDVLLSVNYLYIINENLIEKPKKYAINIHGSLLPRYRGRTPHVWSIINGETKTGVTAHIITPEVDAGDIVSQIEFKIEENDTGADLLKKYELLYPSLIEQLLTSIDNDSIIRRPQNHEQATYYGARTPDDGHINWQWSKERIRNWIRAQAHPYPGAFTFLDDIKIKVHKATFHNMGYDYRTPNGTILNTLNQDVIVKTTNGALLLSQLQYDAPISIKPNMKFL